jgi:hypothetical protein
MTTSGVPSGNMTAFNPPPYQPFTGPGILSNPMAQMAMAMYLPAQVGQGNFLPSLMPSQHIFDQYNSMKYQNARMQGLANMSDIDQSAIAGRLLTLRSGVTDTPATAMNAVQASNMAAMINNPVAKMFISQMMGPELMEDVFFGTKGSAENLYNSVARTGFFRKDSLGGARMTGDSLAGVSREMFSQMYGDDADMSEMNGLNAGRAGALYEDLFRRGTLPKSLGQLSAADRVKVIGQDLTNDDPTLDRLTREFSRTQLSESADKLPGLDKTFNELSRPEQEKQLDIVHRQNKEKLHETLTETRKFNEGTGTKSAEEVQQMAGFDTAARAVDAQRITKSLKDYTGSVAAIREIFGEAGNPNAPMSELLTALEALTQNSVGRADPKKIEKSVRELQLSARGAGVGLQGMLALNAQAAAVGDRFGLDRSFAANATLTGLQAGEAMRNTGKLNMGFGGMSQEEVMFKGAYLEQAAAASATGNMIGVAGRAVTQNRDRHYREDGTAKTKLAAIVEAMKAGEDAYSFVDDAGNEQRGRVKDFTQGQNAPARLKEIALESGESLETINAFIRDRRGTQEFTSQFRDISGMTQRDNLISEMGVRQGNQLRLTNKEMTEEDAHKLGSFMTEALIEKTHAGIPAEDRAKEYLQFVEQKLLDSGKTAAETDKIMTSTFGTGDARLDAASKYIAQQGAQLDRMGAPAGMTQYQLKAWFSKEATEERARLKAEASEQAERRAAFGSAQTSFTARAGDMLLDLGKGEAKDAATIKSLLNIIPADQLDTAMMPGYSSVLKAAGADYQSTEVHRQEWAGRATRAIEEGGTRGATKLAQVEAERLLDINPNTATKEQKEKATELATTILRGTDEEFRAALDDLNVTDATRKRVQAHRDTARHQDETGHGIDRRKDGKAALTERHNKVKELAKLAAEDPKLLEAIVAEEGGAEFLALADEKDAKKLDDAFGGKDVESYQKFAKKLEDLSGGIITKDEDGATEQSKKAAALIKEVTDDAAAAEKALTPDRGPKDPLSAITEASANAGTVVDTLTEAATKVTPALDELTVVARDAAASLKVIAEAVPLVAATTAVTGTGGVASTVAAAAGVASWFGSGGGPITDTVSNTINDIVATGEQALSGVLQLVGLDKVLLRGQQQPLETTPGNGASVHTGAVTVPSKQ